MFDDLISGLSDLLSNAAERASEAFSDLTSSIFGGGEEPPEPPDIGGDYEEPEEEEPERGGDFEYALDHNLHPDEFEDKFGYDPGGDYREKLIEKLDLNGNWDDGNHTERSLYGGGVDKNGDPITAYEQLVKYLESFNGGYPDDDLIEIGLEEGGYRLYVAIDTP